MRTMVGLIAAVVVAASAAAGVQTRELEYSVGETALQGFVAWDAAAEGPRPGVVVVHEWWGHNEHARNQAKRLAEAGYVGFALDMYGKGKVTQHPAEAQAFMQEALANKEVLGERFMEALRLLKEDPHVDPERVAAIGYCFGGGVVLAMARRGVDLDAVATFHGSIGTDQPAQKGAIKARLLILNGADDPMVTPDVAAAFKKEMTDAGAQFEFVNLAGAKHSFTNPHAAHAGMDALVYDEAADQESWSRMLKLFAEVFGE